MHKAITTQFFEKMKSSFLLSLAFSFLLTIILLAKSLADFGMAGNIIQQEITEYYSGYMAMSMARLALWTFLITLYLFSMGVFLYLFLSKAKGYPYKWYYAALFGAATFGSISALQFLKALYFIPSSIVASFHYRISRLYPLLDSISVSVLKYTQTAMIFIAVALVTYTIIKFYQRHNWKYLKTLIAVAFAYSIPLLLSYDIAILPALASATSIRHFDSPNIIMIGSDTLRADRLGAAGYKRNLTPNIDMLAKNGVQFTNFFVPIARTAPSLASYLSGTWPHTHGIRENYNTEDKIPLPVSTLPEILASNGWHTEAITDWAGGDLGKLKFGFDRYDGPGDEWNIKCLIRQGPKDIRLFLSLFTHNEFGKLFLPEIYYLSGTPLTKKLADLSKERITALSQSNKPFFLTIFTSTTHIPFGCEYPYYNLYSDPNYRGESRFSMAGLTTPDEVIKKQGESKEYFDLQQVVDLYDGCVKSFDDIVGEVNNHLKLLGLDRNTILIIFSDHGVDLFEKHTWGQGNSLLGDDPSARVPLVISFPSLPRNRKIPQVARSIDLFPTLLDILNLEPPTSIEGISLLKCIYSECSILQLEAYVETGLLLTPKANLNDQHLHYPSALELLEVPDKSTGTLAIKEKYRDIEIEARDRMIRTDKWKLVYMPMNKGATYWLFNSELDPKGERDVSAEYPEVFADMKHRLFEWMAHDSERRIENEHLVRKREGNIPPVAVALP